MSFGNASLVLSDFDDHPLTHWSLAAVEQQAGDAMPARYAPAADSAEVLEIADAQMIEAIRIVTGRAPIRTAPNPRRGGLRWVGLLLALALIGAGAAWAPGVLRGRALALVSPEQARLISSQIRDALDTRPCGMADGRAALALIETHLHVPVTIMPWDNPRVATLPDGSVLLSQALVQSAASPDDIVGWATAARARAPQDTPLAHWLNQRSFADLIGFLTSGEVTPRDTRQMARILRQTSPPTVAPPAVHDIAPILPSNRHWVALQNICEG